MTRINTRFPRNYIRPYTIRHTYYLFSAHFMNNLYEHILHFKRWPSKKYRTDCIQCSCDKEQRGIVNFILQQTCAASSHLHVHHNRKPSYYYWFDQIIPPHKEKCASSITGRSTSSINIHSTHKFFPKKMFILGELPLIFTYARKIHF